MSQGWSRPISQILYCIRQISHKASFCSRNVHISVTKWCIMGYGTDALWVLCNRTIVLLQNFAETTMNELLAWYGYDKVDEQDTEQLKLPQFAAKEDAANSSRRTSTSQPSSDAGDSNHGDSKSPGTVVVLKLLQISIWMSACLVNWRSCSGYIVFHTGFVLYPWCHVTLLLYVDANENVIVCRLMGADL